MRFLLIAEELDEAVFTEDDVEVEEHDSEFFDFGGNAYISVIILASFEYSLYCSSNNFPASSFNADSGFGYISKHFTVCKKKKKQNY